MARKVEIDSEFDIKGFAELLKKAKAGRTITQFAKDASVSYQLMSGYLNCNRKKPPIPDTLKRIAAASFANVSYKELLETAGYDSTKYVNREDSVRDFIKYSKDFKRFGPDIILSALERKDYRWHNFSKKDNDSNLKYDYVVSLDDNIIEKWYFVMTRIKRHPYKISDNAYQSFFRKSWKTELLPYFGGLLTSDFRPNNLISFVSDDEELITVLKELQPKLCAINISAIIVDEKKSVIKEVFISTADGYSEIKNKCSLL